MLITSTEYQKRMCDESMRAHTLPSHSNDSSALSVEGGSIFGEYSMSGATGRLKCYWTVDESTVTATIKSSKCETTMFISSLVY